MKRKLWNKDFILLLQGKLVSNLGDVLYSVALSFWILETTGSKTMMGILLASQTLVKVLITPFGGVFSDRMSKKKIIVGSDLICGILLTAISIIGFMGYLEVWMIFITGIMMAVCASFFQPAMSAVLPDVVDANHLPQALSANQTTLTLVQIVGQGMSGILLSLFGPVLIFFGNGISYLISSFSESFITVPKKQPSTTQVSFSDDLKSGFSFAFAHKGFRIILTISCLLNFFASGALVLFLPYFMETSVLQGATGYGIASASMTVGTLIGVIFFGLLKLSGKQRAGLFMISIIVEFAAIFMMIIFKSLGILMIATFIFGTSNGLVNIIFNEVCYEIIPEDKRGKVFGLMNTVSMGLTPVSMAIFSFLADLFGTYTMFCFGLSMTGLVSFALILFKEVRILIVNKPVVLSD